MKIYIIIITVAMGIISLISFVLMIIFCNEIEIEKTSDPIAK